MRRCQASRWPNLRPELVPWAKKCARVWSALLGLRLDGEEFGMEFPIENLEQMLHGIHQ